MTSMGILAQEALRLLRNLGYAGDPGNPIPEYDCSHKVTDPESGAGIMLSRRQSNYYLSVSRDAQEMIISLPPKPRTSSLDRISEQWLKPACCALMEVTE